VLSQAIVAAPQAVEPHCEMAYAPFTLRRDHEALKEAEVAKETLEIYQRAAQLDPNDEVAKANFVRMVRPVSGLGLARDFVRMALRPGARIYYDREWGSDRHLRRVVLAAIVFVLGYVAVAVAQGRGWTFVTTGIPTLVLLLGCIGIALSCLLLRR
jgi:hypothetical protein